jgi:hypothetical protein
MHCDVVLNKYQINFDIPKGYYNSSILIFDEPFLHSSNLNIKILLLTIITKLSKNYIIILSSAIPDYFKNFLISNGIKFKNISLKTLTAQLKIEEIEDLNEVINETNSTIILRDSFKDAIETYKKLKRNGFNLYLMNERLAPLDRLRVINNIKNDKNYIIVSDHSLELSSMKFDVVISDYVKDYCKLRRLNLITKNGRFYLIKSSDIGKVKLDHNMIDDKNYEECCEVLNNKFFVIPKDIYSKDEYIDKFVIQIDYDELYNYIEKNIINEIINFKKCGPIELFNKNLKFFFVSGHYSEVGLL